MPPRPPARSWAEIRWRQFRNAPAAGRPGRAASLVVAVVLALAYLAYDVALSRGATLPGGDLRTLAIAAYVVVVLVVGSAVTYLVVPQPTGSGTVVRRSGLERGARDSSPRSRSRTWSWSSPSR